MDLTDVKPITLSPPTPRSFGQRQFGRFGVRRVTSIFPAIRLEHALTIIIAMGQLPHRAIADYYLSLMLSPLKLDLKENYRRLCRFWLRC